MPVFRREQNQVHSMEGNHIAGVATPTSGAQQVEMWHGWMDANSATPPHSHDTEEVVLFLTGGGRATVAGREVSYRPGDTLILPQRESLRRCDADRRQGQVAGRCADRPALAQVNWRPPDRHWGSVSWSSTQRLVLVDRVLPRLKGGGRNELRVLLRHDPARLAKGVDDCRRDARLLHRLRDHLVVFVIGRDIDEDRIIRARLPP